MRVDPVNAAQLDAWDGKQGEFWAANADRFDRAVARHHARLIDEVRPGERVLDIGCGAGLTTHDAARRGAGALGIDLSSAMIALAARRHGSEGVEFVQGDAKVYDFPAAAFDIAISRHGAMFFGDPVGAFTNIARALKGGGRLALITWQAQGLNEFRTAVHTALTGAPPVDPPAEAPSPFSLSDPDRVTALLGKAGFEDVALEAVLEPMCFGRDVDEAFGFLVDHFGGAAEEGDRERAFAALRADVEAHATDDGVLYGSAAWLVTARVR